MIGCTLSLITCRASSHDRRRTVVDRSTTATDAGAPDSDTRLRRSITGPLLFLFVMGGVFGNTPAPAISRGFGPTNYYIPAYIGLVISSIGVISLPVHLTGYRERGVLKRKAASVSDWLMAEWHLAKELKVSPIRLAYFVSEVLTEPEGFRHVLPLLAASR